MEGEVIQNVYRCVQGGRLSRLMCMYALALSLFMLFSYGVLFYLQKFNLILSEKGVFVRNGSIFIVMKQASFTLIGEKSVIRYERTKWMAPEKCCGIFFVH